MSDYLTSVAERVFGKDTDWGSFANNAQCCPRAVFQLQGEFNDTSSIAAYNFIVDLSGLYGEVVEPIGLESGCIAIRLKFNSTVDYAGKPFLDLLQNDAEYHALLEKYSVKRMALSWFPSQMGTVSRRYRVDQNGVPTLF